MIWTLLLLAAGLVAFHFAVYPALMAVLAWRCRSAGSGPFADPDAEVPTVSLVIAAYNEQSVIAAKIANSAALSYPDDRLEIIIVSDGSDDRTHEIAAAHADIGVIAMHEPARRGKSAALNRGVAAASGAIVVFSDANNDFNTGALNALVQHFADPWVGGVCGRKAIRAAAGRASSVGDGLYWRYESRIKIAESAVGIVTTADGEIFAIRRRLYEPIPPHVINDDAEITFALVRRGFRMVYEPRAVSTELASQTLEDDFRVKVRMIAGGFQTVSMHWRQLLPPRSGFAFAFLAHKLLRWSIPLWLLLIGACSLLLSDQPLGATLVAVQVVFYGTALLGWVGRHSRRLPAWKYVPLYFGLMNVAALVGLRRFLAGEGITTIWRKATR